MKQITLPHHAVAAIICALLLCTVSTAQEQPAPQTDKPSVPKVEIGAQYSLLNLGLPAGDFSFGRSVGTPPFGNSDPSPGFGGRVTYNLTEHLAVEAETNFFPVSINGDDDVASGRSFQAQFGVKAGKRFRHFGIFAKARPGLVSFSKTFTTQLGAPFIGVDGGQFFDVFLSIERKTHFALDVGGVIEVYTARRVFVRFDAGDTIIRYGRQDELTGSVADPIFSIPARTQHSLQISAGVGVRLGAIRDEADAPTRASAARPSKATRFEAGAQFTSISFSPIRQISSGILITSAPAAITEPGFGGRFTYNLTDYLAVEAETNLLPRQTFLAQGASGRVTQGQFGVKAGHRFHSFGVFAKARPGFVSFGSSLIQVGLIPIPDLFNRPRFHGVFEVGRRTFFAGDVGGVIELYPSRRWLLRFDGGDTIIHYGERSINTFFATPSIIFAPPETRHNFQLSTGVGFRF